MCVEFSFLKTVDVSPKVILNLKKITLTFFIDFLSKISTKVFVQYCQAAKTSTTNTYLAIGLYWF